MSDHEPPVSPGMAQLERLMELAGICPERHQGIPVIKIDDDLRGAVRDLAMKITNLEMFEQNGDLVYFDHRGERRLMTARAFRTWINRHCLISSKTDKATGHAIPIILTTDQAATILEAPDFLSGVRTISGMNKVALPVIRPGGDLELLPTGYDLQTRSFTIPDVTYPTDLPFEAAKGCLHRMFASFPFADERSMAVQVAAMLALYVRHLPGGSSLRPGFLWLANKPETGKSVAAKAAQYAVMGRAPAVKMKKGEQLDKEMEAFMIAGVPSLFLDNVYGGIQSATIDQMLTSEESEGRAMGGHGLFRARNSALLFVTGNRLELNDDATRRFLVVDIFETGNPADRQVKPDDLLCDDVMRSPEWRSRMLSVCWALVAHWHAQGMPQGSVVRGSFEAYSRLLGGIVEAAGYVNPFQLAEIPDAINPDRAEFMDFLKHVVADMGESRYKEYELEPLARIARANGLYSRIIGTQEDGVRLTIKRDCLEKGSPLAADRGYLENKTVNQDFSAKLKVWQGQHPVLANGTKVEFGKREGSRLATFKITILN